MNNTNSMTLDESMDEETTVSKKLALIEVINHGASTAEFISEIGDKSEYSTKQILIWLGY